MNIYLKLIEKKDLNSVAPSVEAAEYTDCISAEG